MTASEVFLGLDTSNYTTSLSVLSSDGEIIANIKRPLPVKEGERGLRQSEAVFSHIKNMPYVMEEAEEYIRGRRILAVGVSTRPRNQEGSYMPCFLTGIASAESIARTHGVPIYRFSHQCGHIMSALYSSKAEIDRGESFLAFHVSGGTTECLAVRRDDAGFSAELVGGSKDLNAGQLIDRIGVKLGLRFPAGPAMEQLALEYEGRLSYKHPRAEGTFVNLSGLENMAEKMLQESQNGQMTAAFVLNYVADALLSITDAALDKYGRMPLVFAGGVMCNSIIKNRISERYSAYFAHPSLSSDNAVGISVLAREEFFRQKR